MFLSGLIFGMLIGGASDQTAQAFERSGFGSQADDRRC